MTRTIIFCISMAWLFGTAAMAGAGTLKVSDFGQTGLKGWQEKSFMGQTIYRLEKEGDHVVLMAGSETTASALIKKIRVNIKQYPFLNWRWKAENRLDTADKKTKAGDDYVLRVYVIIDGGILVWRTLAVNYVWAGKARKNEIWENAFVGKNSMMMALRTRQDKTSTWYTEKRNVYEDLKQLFGEEKTFIDAVAVMTDTDNSGGSARAYYGEIFFSQE